MESLITVTWSFVLSSGVAAAVAAAVVWFGREVIGEKIKNAIRHEYDLRLAEATARLTAENARSESERATVASLFASTHVAGFQRRVVALERAWDAAIQLRSLVPAGFLVLDQMETDLHKGVMALDRDSRQKYGDGEVRWSGFEKALRQVLVEKPFIGEAIWLRFTALFMLTNSLVVHVQNALVKGDATRWHESPGPLRHVELSVDAKSFAAWRQKERGLFISAQSLLEDRLAGEIAHTLLGKASGEAAFAEVGRLRELEQQRLIDEAAQKAQAIARGEDLTAPLPVKP